MLLIYKILPASLWRAAEAEGVFKGADIDVQDGFIHFSTVEQVEETAAKHFAGKSDLLLVVVAVERLGLALLFEPSRGGALFPHLYGDLPLHAVTRVSPLPLRADGSHDFSGLLS
jgi:uncharacterized protein (DUF952 family)